MECKDVKCKRYAVARGMCLMHYKRWRRLNRDKIFNWKKSLEQRFIERVRKTDTCWLWTAKTLHGYGKLSTGSSSNGTYKAHQAHRISYEMYKGKIPEGYQIDHLCNNRRCVNPDHLEAVTPRENILRGGGVSAQNAKKTHCPHGHEYTKENTILNKDNHRKCKECRDLRYRKWKVAYNEDSA